MSTSSSVDWQYDRIDVKAKLPYKGVAATVQGRIEAENYDEGCSGSSSFR